MTKTDIARAIQGAALDLAAVRRAVRHTSGEVAMNDTLQQRAREMAKQFDGGDEDDVRGEFIRELADRLDVLESDVRSAAESEVNMRQNEAETFRRCEQAEADLKAARAVGVREGLERAVAMIRESEAKPPLTWRAHMDYASALGRLAQEIS